MRVDCPAAVIRGHSASLSSTAWTGRHTWRRHSTSSTRQLTVEVRRVEALDSNMPYIDEPVAQKSPTSSPPSGLYKQSRSTHFSVYKCLALQRWSVLNDSHQNWEQSSGGQRKWSSCIKMCFEKVLKSFKYVHFDTGSESFKEIVSMAFTGPDIQG